MSLVVNGPHLMGFWIECAHQPLKRCVVLRNHHDMHIFQANHYIENEWINRFGLKIAFLSRIMKRSLLKPPYIKNRWKMLKSPSRSRSDDKLWENILSETSNLFLLSIFDEQIYPFISLKHILTALHMNKCLFLSVFF